MMNDQLKQLLELQAIDQVIERLQSELESQPLAIEAKKSEIKQAQDAFVEEKNKLTTIQLSRKNKEMEVATQDEKIRKHGMELNSVKSNEAYKALLTEIDNAKNEKVRIEDEILGFMEDYDRVQKELKIAEENAKTVQKKLESEIKEIEAQIAQTQGLLDSENKKREDFAPKVSQDLLSRYDYIRKRKKSSVIAAISGESCTGCNTNLTPDVMNQVKKGKELVLCESCSRILYIPDPQPISAS